MKYRSESGLRNQVGFVLFQKRKKYLINSALGSKTMDATKPNDENTENADTEIVSSNTSRISYEAEGEITVLKSLCMNCEEQGITRLLLTRIPFFRDVILMAFECPHCGFRSSEVQSAEVQARGCCFTVTLTTTLLDSISTHCNQMTDLYTGSSDDSNGFWEIYGKTEQQGGGEEGSAKKLK